MKFEEKRRMDRKEIESLLKGMGDLLGKGELRIGEKTVLVPDSMDVEVEYKEKDERAKFEIELKWDKKSAQKKIENQGSIVSEYSSISEVKQEMKSRFNALRGKVEKGGFPSEKEVLEFISMNQRFRELSDGEGYDRELGDFSALLDRFSIAVKGKRTDEVKRLVDDIRASKKSCHKTYRWKEE